MDRAWFMAIIMIKTAGVCLVRAYVLLVCYARMGRSTHPVEFLLIVLWFYVRCQHDLLLSPPKEKHSVKYAELLKAEQGGEPGGLTTGLNVHVDDSHMELIFYASSPNEAQVSVNQIAAV